MVRSLRFATYLSPNVRPVYEYVAGYVGRTLGVETDLVVGGPYEQLEADGHDVAFICGLPYVLLTDRSEPAVEPLVAPVLSGERYGGRPIYYSDVIVRRDAPFGTFADLRGSVWAYNEPWSHSGYNITRYHLARLGETGGYFGKVLEAGFHLKAVRMVREGRADASAIDSQVLEIELRDDPTLRQELRVVEVLGPATIQPVVASRRLPEDLRRDLRTVLVDMADDAEARQALARGLVDRFVPVSDADYDDIREMAAAAEAAGLAVLR